MVNRIGMPKWILVALVVLGVAAAGVVGAGLALPKTFRLTSTKMVAAHPARILPLISRLERWEEWWPWDERHAGKRLKLEPDAIASNQALAWDGRPAPGKLKLTETTIFRIRYELQFACNKRPDSGFFEFKANPAGTAVTWQFDGHFEHPVWGGYLAAMAGAMHGGMLSWGLEKIRQTAESDKSELNLYYTDEQGREAIERIE